MQIAQLVGVLVVFFTAIFIIMKKIAPTVLVLPVMAVLIAAVAGVPLFTGKFTIFKDVLEAGSMKIASGMAGLIFGGWFAHVLTKTGITKGIIRKAAELAGDKPFAIAMVFTVVIAFIFASASGLGITILVGSIVMPIMITAGLSPLTSAIILLTSAGMGTSFNFVEFAIYQSVLGMDIATITHYAWMAGVPVILVGGAMIIWRVLREKKVTKAWAMPADVDLEINSEKNVRSIALISPIIPVILVFFFKVTLVPSCMIGIVCALLLTTPRKPLHVLSSALIEGIQNTAGALALMIGIGMLLVAVSSPQVSGTLMPLMNAISPKNPLMYIIVFSILCPLAIYRGPMNVWGLGSGVIALFVASGMNPITVFVGMHLCRNVQYICDPTNTHTVWASDFNKIDVIEITKSTMPWIVASAVLGFIFTSFLLPF